jgi:hypothetical protein
MVDPRAYAPTARKMARLGIHVIVVPMPANLAITGIDRANDVINPKIKHWFIGGHSMGGAMAVRFVNKFTSTPEISGIVLWAAYADSSDDLSGTMLPVLSISGSLDGVATPEEIESGKAFLPSSTEYQVLKGGNHAQFGKYGEQNGDLAATLSSLEQEQLVAALTSHFVKRVTLDLVADDQPFIDSIRATELCHYGQLLVLDADEEIWGERITVNEYDDFNLFDESVPSLKLKEEQIHFEVQAIVRPFGNGMLPERRPILPGEVWCKMKTRAAFEKAQGIDTSPQEIGCSSINKRSLELAIAALKESSNHDLKVDADIHFEMEADWLKNGTSILDDHSIQSPQIIIGNDKSLPEDNRNAMYCKLWSPSRALYYLMTGD